MKRLLSALLTLALVLSLIPAVFAEDTAKEQVYDFMDTNGANHAFLLIQQELRIQNTLILKSIKSLVKCNII